MLDFSTPTSSKVSHMPALSGLNNFGEPSDLYGNNYPNHLYMQGSPTNLGARAALRAAATAAVPGTGGLAEGGGGLSRSSISNQNLGLGGKKNKGLLSPQNTTAHWNTPGKVTGLQIQRVEGPNCLNPYAINVPDATKIFKAPNFSSNLKGASQGLLGDSGENNYVNTDMLSTINSALNLTGSGVPVTGPGPSAPIQQQQEGQGQQAINITPVYSTVPWEPKTAISEVGISGLPLPRNQIDIQGVDLKDFMARSGAYAQAHATAKVEAAARAEAEAAAKAAAKEKQQNQQFVQTGNYKERESSGFLAGLATFFLGGGISSSDQAKKSNDHLVHMDNLGI